MRAGFDKLKGALNSHLEWSWAVPCKLSLIQPMSPAHVQRNMTRSCYLHDHKHVLVCSEWHLFVLQVAFVHTGESAASVRTLTRQLSEPRSETQTEAASALRNLAQNAGLRIRGTIADTALSPLLSLLKDTANARGRAQAAATLSVLARNHDLSRNTADAALPLLISLLKDGANSEGR